MAENNKIAELSDQVKEKYKMKRGHHVGRYNHRGVEFDLASVDLETLDRAVALGFGMVEEIKPKPKGPDLSKP